MAQAAYVGIPTTKVLTPLGSQAAGSVVKMMFDGEYTDFIVLHQGLPSSIYDSSCNGTWVTIRYPFEQRQWSGSQYDKVLYSNCNIHSYLNDTVINRFDEKIKNFIKQVKIPHCTDFNKTVASGANGLSAKLFLLSAIECNGTSYGVNDGAPLTAFVNDSSLLMYRRLTTEQTQSWWFRTVRNADAPNTCYGSMGYMGAHPSSNSNYIRFAMILPSDLGVYENGAITGEPAGESETSISRKITKGHIGVDGIARGLSAGYVGVEGVARQFLSKPWLGYLINGTTLSEFGLPTADFWTGMIRNYVPSDWPFYAYSSGSDPVTLSNNRVYFRAPFEKRIHYSFWPTPFNFSGVNKLTFYATKANNYAGQGMQVLISPTLPVVDGDPAAFEMQLSGTTANMSGTRNTSTGTTLDVSHIQGKQYIGIRLNQWSYAGQGNWYIDKLLLE